MKEIIIAVISWVVFIGSVFLTSYTINAISGDAWYKWATVFTLLLFNTGLMINACYYLVEVTMSD